MSEQELKPCKECGMAVSDLEYHPFAACLMFKGCGDKYTVLANLEAIRQHDKAWYIAIAKTHKWSEEYNLNSNQQSENRAIDRVIAAMKAVE